MTPQPVPTAALKPRSPAPYVFAVVLMIVVGAVLSLGVLLLRPMADPLVVIGGIYAVVITPTTAAIMAFLKSNDAFAQSQETYHMVNSRLTDFMTADRVEAHRKGMDDARAQDAGRAPAPQELPAKVVVVAGEEKKPE